MKRHILSCIVAAASFVFVFSGCSTTSETTKVEQVKAQPMTGDAREGADTGDVKKVGYGKKAYRDLK
ncbi:MAG: hypothetical protein JXQ73_20720 [Phycisphaerae bacterium]|nr:hypothetical protein [Phycisphaerae bacterium]